jgi:hypothetical protein
MEEQVKRVTGIIWWKPKQWERAKRISTDSHVFDDSYEEWKEAAEQTFKNLRDLRLEIHKLEIDLDELVKWCKDQDIPLNGKARSQFASMKVKEHYGDNS